ncbi:UDP-glucose dehydrogenase family protein [Heliorestis convoluta]|uniref:UDP-glucose 6-dehydrogenase n=1 Tax=Heliorestis convoluta TaxID=356322 RepID=A0A5Q2N0W1_9FIRM|nr:UDP-glucose/GDP-mannose dehydrogenase family protein [Heliorestis convoluta]QGG47196.1 UDP-glucose/GDP-mannose dehydrogenase family protein [Heliorestis convoluta]
MHITIIGCGYVGLTTAVSLAYMGRCVHVIDQNEERIQMLRRSQPPIHEKGLEELLNQTNGRLTFGTWDSFEIKTDVVIIAVGTPSKENGDADLSYVEAVARELGQRLTPQVCDKSTSAPVIVNKSTVPIGSARRVQSIISQHLKERNIVTSISVASNPEFLREGVALHDTFYPDRIVIGSEDTQAAYTLREMYAPILEQTFSAPEFLPRPENYLLPAFIITSPTSAELIKYAANTFLAMKISYINEIAGLSEKVGADIQEVARGIGLDKRIGSQFLNAGIGWGGSCFPKDVQALIHTGEQYGYAMPLSQSAIDVNYRQREEVIKKLQSALKVLRGRTIGLLGLAFKPGTDDLRDAPAITIAERLIELGVHVKAYDPIAMENCRHIHPNLAIEYVSSSTELVNGIDALILITEWNEFIHLPYKLYGEKMRQKVILDGRNALNSQALRDAGFTYIGVGK